MSLTKRDIDKLVFDPKKGSQQIMWDADGSGANNAMSGFGVRVYSSGKKSFVLFYRLLGRQHIKVIGQFGVLTLEQAKEIARRDLTALLDRKDPLAERKKNRQGTEFNELCRLYIERHAKPKKKSWLEDQRRIEKYLLPEFGSLRVDAITKSDVARFHSKLGEQFPYAANRCLEQLSVMFSMSEDWGYLERNAINPAQGIKAFAEVKRDRWISPDELPHLARAIENEANLYGRQGLWLYLLTGLRRDELLNAQWQDIDWKRKELRLGDTKSGRTHYVPLSAPAIAILNELPRVADNPYVLP
jgi:integrase